MKDVVAKLPSKMIHTYCQQSEAYKGIRNGLSLKSFILDTHEYTRQVFKELRSAQGQQHSLQRIDSLYV